MKTAFPKNIFARQQRSCRALTILEMLVSTALLSFIILGLTAMFIETQKAFKTGIKQSSVTDAGRTIIDMIASDMSQMTDPHFTNVLNPYSGINGFGPYPLDFYREWVPAFDLIQVFSNGTAPVYRTNQVEDIFALVQTNSTWMGIGYSVSNWFTNSAGAPFPGIGTLYRYVTYTNGPLAVTNTLFASFSNGVMAGFSTNCHPVADGVVHLKVYAYDADGNEDPAELTASSGTSVALQYPIVIIPASNLLAYQTNYLPHSVDIELGILEPEAFEHARSLYTAGALVAASNYLANCAGQVQIFRQHIIIPAAP